MTNPEPARKVSRSIQIRTTPEKALEAFLVLDALSKWWGASTGLIQAQKGGVYALAWKATEEGFAYLGSGVIKSYRPGKRLRIDSMVYFGVGYPPLGPMRLTINVRERDGRTRVSVRQEGFGNGPDWDRYYDAVSQGWKESLKNLKIFLEDQV